MGHETVKNTKSDDINQSEDPSFETEKKCNIELSFERPIQRLSINDIIRRKAVREVARSEELDYTINEDPDDDAVETFGNIEDGQQYLLKATYRIVAGQETVAKIKWDQNKDSDTSRWELKIELESSNHKLIDALFQAVQEKMKPKVAAEKNVGLTYHV